MRPLPCLRLRLVVLASCLLLAACATRPSSTHTAHLAPPAPATGTDALPRWRAALPEFSAALRPLDLPIVENLCPDEPLPAFELAALAPAAVLLPRFVLAPGETLALPRIHGPETPFPDHQPLREVANFRTFHSRVLIAAGDFPAATALVRQNLAQARATLLAQTGILPLIHATGVWQTALDSVHALARSPALSPETARSLLAELQGDSALASIALDRALRGEYTDVLRVIVERMPRTDDPDLLLSSVSSLGMGPPEPLAPGELGLGITDHPLLDTAATLDAFEADLVPYLAALARSSRLPRDLYATTTAPVLAAYRRDLGAFYDYAGGNLPPTILENARARAALESTPNPVGKLLALYLTSPWDVIISSALRREAQRAALCGLLAWRAHGRPASWETLIAAGLLPAAPADPFSDAPLRFDLGPRARIWSVHLDAADQGGEPVLGNTGQPADLVWLW